MLLLAPPHHHNHAPNRKRNETQRNKQSDAPPLTLEDLEAHCEATASQLLYAQLAAAGVKSRDADHAASHLGKAYGLAMALRGAPFQASRRRSVLPVEVCARCKVSQESIFR